MPDINPEATGGSGEVEPFSFYIEGDRKGVFVNNSTGEERAFPPADGQDVSGLQRVILDEPEQVMAFIAENEEAYEGDFEVKAYEIVDEHYIGIYYRAGSDK